MAEVLEIVNGKCVTALEGLTPPSSWTNDYSEMGYDKIWGPDGEVAELVWKHGIRGQLRPLFSMRYYKRQDISVFQIVDGSFYLYKPHQRALLEITSHTDLGSIIATIDDDNKGWEELATKPV